MKASIVDRGGRRSPISPGAFNENAAAGRVRSAVGKLSSGPRTMPATMELPAPMVLLTVDFGGKAWAASRHFRAWIALSMNVILLTLVVGNVIWMPREARWPHPQAHARQLRPGS